MDSTEILNFVFYIMVNVYVGESSPVFRGGFHPLFAITKDVYLRWRLRHPPQLISLNYEEKYTA